MCPPYTNTALCGSTTHQNLMKKEHRRMEVRASLGYILLGVIPTHRRQKTIFEIKASKCYPHPPGKRKAQQSKDEELGSGGAQQCEGGRGKWVCAFEWSEFQHSKGFTERPCLKRQRAKKAPQNKTKPSQGLLPALCLAHQFISCTHPIICQFWRSHAPNGPPLSKN